MNRADQALIDAKKHFQRADSDVMNALRKAMRRGRQVSWMHGRHWRSGTVVKVRGIGFSHADVVVRSSVSGKVYDVGAAGLVSDLIGGAT